MRTQEVNAIAAASKALQTRRNEQIVFLTVAGHTKEQPPKVEPSSDTASALDTSVSVATVSSLPPDWVCQRESHCTYGINTGNGYYGKWQFHPGTWTSGANQWNASHVEQIPNDVSQWASVQPWMEDAVAEMIWQSGAGASHWGL